VAWGVNVAEEGVAQTLAGNPYGWLLSLGGSIVALFGLIGCAIHIELHEVNAEYTTYGGCGGTALATALKVIAFNQIAGGSGGGGGKQPADPCVPLNSGRQRVFLPDGDPQGTYGKNHIYQRHAYNSTWPAPRTKFFPEYSDSAGLDFIFSQVQRFGHPYRWVPARFLCVTEAGLDFPVGWDTSGARELSDVQETVLMRDRQGRPDGAVQSMYPWDGTPDPP
jgi:hypothetical protein